MLCALVTAGLFEMSRDTELGVALYSRRVLIKNKTDNILPKWLRFVKGKSQGIL
jgi:TNF receptor-associated protein 1